MNQITTGNGFSKPHAVTFARAFIVAGFLLGAGSVLAQIGPPSGGGDTPLNSWSFGDSVYWTSDNGYAPVSFTNISLAQLGNGYSLVVDTNVPAWLQYNVWESDGTTNLTVSSGTVMFWFAPGSWSSTNLGGAGPGEYGRLLEAGAYTPDSSYGWWSIYVDDVGANIYFSTQTNDLSGTYTTFVSAPISWTNDYFHFVTLTYSTTNTVLYLDGVPATNGPGVTVFPGPDVLTNGFCIGGDNTGVYQSHGLFNTVQTFNYPLGSNDVQQIFTSEYTIYQITPWNPVMSALTSAPFTPSYTPTYDAIAGQGNLSNMGSTTNCVNGTNAFNVWITNVTARAIGGGAMVITFTIEGGAPSAAYDVFANSALSFGTNGIPWAWEGQGFQCNTYQLTITNAPAVFIILGTPMDSDGDGLTDAYELLVSKTNPYNPDTSGDGISDSDKILLGLNPLVLNPAFPANPTIQTCP